jgi:phage shock protein A
VAPPPTAEEREQHLRALHEEAAGLRRQLEAVEARIEQARDS